MRRFEFLIALLVLAVLAAAWGLDRAVPARSIPGAPAAKALPLLSEAWYCPSVTAELPGATVSTANTGTAGTHLRRTGTSGPPEADLASSALANVAVAPSLPTATVAIEAFGQPTVSTLGVLSTGAGGATSRCSSQPGSRWLFAMASTAPGLDTYVLIANPFQEAAAVSVRVLTATGDRVPTGLNVVQVPAASQVTIFLSDFLTASPAFGLDVTATRGRVVVGRLMKVATREGVRGLALDVGVPQPGPRWIFAAGGTPTQGTETFQVANPSDREALVSVLFQTEGSGAPPGAQQVPVPAGGQVSLKIDQLPPGTRHGTIVTSTNGVPVVVERQTVSGQGSSQSFQSVLGVPDTATRWAVPAGSSVGGTDNLVVLAAGQDSAEFSVSILTPSGKTSPPSLTALKVDPGQRGTYDVTAMLGGQPGLLLVEATSGQVAVENDLGLPNDYRQTVASQGIPLG